MNKKRKPLILAVDTSCDDTSAAVVCENIILSNIIASQTELHKPYGGVFPTVAKQAHKENIEATVQTALKRAGIALNKIDVLAVTVGPGLAPALEVGINYMKNLAKQTGKPLIAVNHIEGHALSVLAQRNSKNGLKFSKTINSVHDTDDNINSSKNNTDDAQSNNSNQKIQYPVLSIIVSGGHTQFILFNEIGKYEIIGTSLDDAAGECLDKIGRMLNLGYPAGPTMEKFAKLGDQYKIKFPLPMTTTKTFDMSFSGLKTFARNYIEDTYGKTSLNKQQIYDMCASTQYGVFRHITYKLNKVLEKHNLAEVWLGGGVAANIKLREMIRESLSNFEKTIKFQNQFLNDSTNDPDDQNYKKRQVNKLNKITFRTPFTNRLCMDNAAMIGIVARYKLKRGEIVTNIDSLDRTPRFKIDHHQT